jgi:hypothetical protein
MARPFQNFGLAPGTPQVNGWNTIPAADIGVAHPLYGAKVRNHALGQKGVR